MSFALVFCVWATPRLTYLGKGLKLSPHIARARNVGTFLYIPFTTFLVAFLDFWALWLHVRYRVVQCGVAFFPLYLFNFVCLNVQSPLRTSV